MDRQYRELTQPEILAEYEFNDHFQIGVEIRCGRDFALALQKNLSYLLDSMGRPNVMPTVKVLQRDGEKT